MLAGAATHHVVGLPVAAPYERKSAYLADRQAAGIARLPAGPAPAWIAGGIITPAEVAVACADGGDDTALAPVGCWPEHARRFADLFPPSYILADAFVSAATTDQWRALAGQGFVRLSPLHSSRQHITTFIPDEPLPEKEEKGKKVKHRSKAPADTTAIAFLEREGTGLDVVRKSRGRAVEFLKFLITSALLEDTSALDIQVIECDCGESHQYHPAAWLWPLWDRKWVPFGGGQAPATAESLARLLKEQDESPNLVTEGTGAKLLAALKISVADLLLRTVAADETARVSYIGSASELMEAVGDDPAKARLVAAELNRSRDLVEHIIQHRERREKVLRNQLVGATVETLLKSVLEGRGLRVTRTGVGSDFEVESDLVDDGREILLEVSDTSRSFLIEVKTTTVSTVRMTVAQARTAREHGDSFALCVVTLDAPEITAEMVERNCRFVMDIGVRLEDVWPGYSRLELVRREATTPSAGVELIVTGTETRFAVAATVWNDSLPLSEAIDFFSTDTLES
jgi:hypothetical protein